MTNPMNLTNIKTVRLLLAVAPTIFKDSPFVLKGGTAINLFLRDMPRLSVDLDLVVADYRLSRDEAFRVISAALEWTATELSKAGYVCEVGATKDGDCIHIFDSDAMTHFAFVGVTFQPFTVISSCMPQVKVSGASRPMGDWVFGFE
jgi:hypothetical protein